MSSYCHIKLFKRVTYNVQVNYSGWMSYVEMGIQPNYTVFQKTRDHVLEDKLN